MSTQPMLRQATVHDAPAITDLSSQLGYAMSVEATKRLLEVMSADPRYCLRVAICNEHLVGWIQGDIVMRLESGRFAEITGLVVDENYRKQGIGRQLIDELGRWAQQQDCRTLRVRCNRIRTETHRFYEGLGFEVCKEQLVFDKQLT